MAGVSDARVYMAHLRTIAPLCTQRLQQALQKPQAKFHLITVYKKSGLSLAAPGLIDL